MIPVIRFEWRLRLRQPATWLYMLVFFLLTFLFVTTDVVQIGGADGPVKATSPVTVSQIVTILGALGSVVAAALVGTAIQRDSDAKVADLFATTGISTAGYYFGRFIGAWLVSLLVYSALPLGLMVGSVMPWVDPETIAPFDPRTWGNAFALLLAPNLLICGALFFVFGTASRSLMAIYTLGVGLFVLWGVSSSLLGNLDNRTVSAALDPFGLGALREQTRYWSVFDQNSRQIGFTGWFLWNRLAWCGAALLLLAGGWKRFSWRTDGRVRRSVAKGSNSRPPLEAVPAPSGRLNAPIAPPRWFSTVRTVARNTHSDMVRGISYKLIVLAGLLLLGSNIWFADRIFDNETLLLTPVVLEAGFGSFMLFFIILITVYASEAIWRERTVRLDQISDALPVSSSAVAIGKYLALCAMLVRTTVLVGLGCVVLQAVKGSPSIDIGLVVSYVGVAILPQLFVLAAFATFVHTLVDHRFVGHGIVLGLFVMQLVLPVLGLDHGLLDVFSIPTPTLSDMNGYGPFLEPMAWYMLAWGSLAAALLVLASKWWIRGRDTRLARRVRGARLGVAGGASLSLFALATAGSAAWILINTHVRHDYRSSKAQIADRARYETTFRKQWIAKDQPKVVKVDLDVNLFPSQGDYVSTGTLTLRNTSKQPIDDVFLGYDPDASDVKLDFGNGSENVFRYPDLGVQIHSLKQALAPGADTTLRFRIARTREGFPDGAPPLDVVANGSFLTMPVPSIGYQEGAEIADDSERRRQGLAKKAQMGDPDDPKSRLSSYIGKDADWVEFACTVRTEPGQTAVAPGYLEKQWDEDGKSCFRYVMDVPIRYFFTVVSAKYAVKRDFWTAPDGRKVALEVYHHPAHTWNVDRMIRAMKDTLAYCEESFTPFQYRQMRILEFPAYATFAQSFPNTVPYSEGIGFVLKSDPDPRALNTAYYVTAHEVAHQWWAHQVVGADAAGSEMLSESLADYTALRIATRSVPPAGRRRAAQQNLDRYLRGRGADRIGENALVRVQHQDYIHYSKGSLVLSALADRVGEKALNQAISRFAREHAFGAAPYPTGEDFVAHLEVEFPAQKAWIADQFRLISLVDFRVVDAKKTRQADGRWKVEANVVLESRLAGSDGGESPKPFSDRVKVWLVDRSDRREYAGSVLSESGTAMVPGGNKLVLVCDKEPVELILDPLFHWIGNRPADRVKKL